MLPVAARPKAVRVLTKVDLRFLVFSESFCMRAEI
jgi:hypothetical protein